MFIHHLSVEAVPLCRRRNKTERAREGEQTTGNVTHSPTARSLAQEEVSSHTTYFIRGFFSAKMSKQSLGQGAEPTGGTTSGH